MNKVNESFANRLVKIDIGAMLLCIILLAMVTSSYATGLPVYYSKTNYSYRAMDVAALEESFKEPPIEAGPWVYWFCFDNAITAVEMEREIKEMVAAGISGAELRFVEFAWWREKEVVDKELEMSGHKRLEYLSDEFVDVLEHACSVAERYDFKLSINMGMGWPPGGTWITEPYRSRALKSKVTEVQGPAQIGNDVKVSVQKDAKVFAWQLEKGEGKSIKSGSFVDLTNKVKTDGEEGQLIWNAPQGRWLVGVYWLGYGGGLDKAYGYPADPGSKEAIEFHLGYLFDKIEPKLGKYFGTTLTEAASDSWEYDGRAYWTPQMEKAFSNLHGYDLNQRLYALAGYGDDREKIMADIQTTQQQLVRDNFFVPAKKILNTHGLGHRPQAYGRGMSRNLFDSYINCDIPEIEEGVYCPEAIWSSHILGKPITSVEGMTFGSRHVGNLIQLGSGKQLKGYGIDVPQGSWETNPAMLRYFSNAHYARGTNRVQMHSFSYSPDGVPLPGWRMYAEIHLNRNVAWWKYMNLYGTWARRMQWILQSGWPVADTLVYPVEGNEGDHHNAQSDEHPDSAMNSVDAANTDAFSRIWKNDGNRYDIANLCLLSDIKTLKEARKIGQMIRRRVKVTYCDVEPQKWTVFSQHKGRIVEDLSMSIKKAQSEGKIIDGRQKGWKQVVEDNRSVRWYPENSALTYFHRRVEGAEVYFVMNCGKQFDGELEFNHRGLIPQKWDADSGIKTVCGQWRICGEKIRVKVRVGSAVIVFAKGKQMLHATDCQGGEIKRGADGKLYAMLEQGEKCTVHLSNGVVRNLQADTPEEINLDSQWYLHAESAYGIGIEGKTDIKLDRLKSWRDISELHRYSGIGTYMTTFDVPSEMLRDDLLVELDLGMVYEVAEVRINGKNVGVSWCPPYRLNITGYLKQGSNNLRIDVANVLKNHLTAGEYSRPSGLVGPVKIRGISKLALQ
jgi:hypothetical protein